MKNINQMIIAMLFLWLPALLQAQQFVFTPQDGASYRLLSVVIEDVFVNGELSHQAEIASRIVLNEEKLSDERAKIYGTYQTSERSKGSTGLYEWGRTYASEYERDLQGRIGIEDQYLMPVVRNVPIFPEQEIEPGDSWRAWGDEVHDMRDAFGVVLRFPVLVSYSYAGTTEYKDKEVYVFDIAYDIEADFNFQSALLVPIAIAGRSEQRLYWNLEKSRPIYAEDAFIFILTLSNGTEVIYQGLAETKVLEMNVLDKNEVLNEINESIKDEGIEDAEARIDEEGITISLENIQFLPESAELLESEIEKINKIAQILSKYSDRDILVSGHTALAGTAAGRERLSRDRAAAVGEKILSFGTHPSEQIIIEGFGARRPIASNATEEGRRKNRRVEITILD
jgi:outer membrane protein OmpA-like peptidoglycan-associated protein